MEKPQCITMSIFRKTRWGAIANNRQYDSPMDEGRKRVLAIAAAILVARHLKNPEDLHESRPSPRTESLIASAVQWAERIMRRIDGLYR